MNKVKRCGRTTIVMEETYNLDKFKWECCECGKVYVMRNDAQRCNHKEYMLVDGIGYRWVEVKPKQ